MLLNKIFTSTQDLENKVFTKLNTLFPNAEWLNADNQFMKVDTLYNILDLYYGDRNIRYDNESTFISKFTFDLADLLPDIYAKQLVFIKNELKQYLSDAQNRAVKLFSGSTTNRDQTSNSKTGTGTTPVNMVITDPAEIENLPLNSANLNQVRLVDNFNGSNESTNFKYIEDITRQLNADYSLRLQEFMNLLKKHFAFIQTTPATNEDITNLYSGVRFRNGYYVPDVDYLGVQNQDAINSLSGKVGNNTTAIQAIQGTINTLPTENDIKGIEQDITNIKQHQTAQDGNISNISSEQTNIKNEQTTQANTIQTIETQQGVQDANIQKNTELINQVVEGLKKIDVSQYITRQEYNTGQQKQNTKIDANTNDIATNTNDIANLGTKDNELSAQINAISSNLNTNYYAKNEIDAKQQEQNTKIDANTNDIATNTNSINTINANLNNKQNTFKLVTQPRNIDISNFTFTGNYLDGHQIWEGVMVFVGQNETNLVNGCTILLGAYLYNMTDNEFISPESVNLRVYNSYQIRASLPNDTKQYRLYFIGVKN